MLKMLKTIFFVTCIDRKGNIHVGVEHFTYFQAHFSKNRCNRLVQASVMFDRYSIFISLKTWMKLGNHM